jgi:tetratricopeptide (TPR) repeat protein
VLSGLLGLSALLCYVRFAQKRSTVGVRGPSTQTSIPGGTSRRGGTDYAAALLLFALGLMSKPMLVTWPFIMLLLDWWPLNRLANGEGGFPLRRILVEKLPFFAMAAATSIVTLVVQSRTAALVQSDRLPLGTRTQNALVSLVRYLGHLAFPSGLAVFYPHPGAYLLGQVVPAAGLLVVITTFCLMMRRHRPFLLFGWLWFCGTLVPVLGFVQAGEQSMADRYTYLPSIGVFVMAIWEMNALTERWRWRTVALPAIAGLVLCLCLGVTRRQLGHWQNSETLFRHALAVTSNNHLAHNNLGAALNDPTRIDEAIQEFEEAVRLRPGYARAHSNLGSAYLKKGRLDEAIAELRAAVRLNPDSAQAHKTLGTALHRQGRSDEAVAELRQGLRLKPDFAEAHYNLGTILLAQRRAAEAALEFRAVIEQRPDHAEARNNLGIALGMQGETDAAVAEFKEALRLKPDYVQAQSNLAHLLNPGRD